MDDLDVRIVQLEPLHVAASLGYGASPEMLAWEPLLAWAGKLGLLEDAAPTRFFGFNNPSPTQDKPEYGYEAWVTVPASAQPGDKIQIKDFPGGLYAVTRCQGGENIAATWEQLYKWSQANPYRIGDHQWLEEHLAFIGLPFDQFLMDLYLPIEK